MKAMYINPTPCCGKCKKHAIFGNTHNRRTMESVDRILGITKEEPGCSSVYSVQSPPP
jgi:hypothetical protein